MVGYGAWRLTSYELTNKLMSIQWNDVSNVYCANGRAISPIYVKPIVRA